MNPSQIQSPSPLAAVIDRHVGEPGDCATAIPGLALFRRDQVTPPSVCMVEPSLILVARGEKSLWIGGEGYPYDPSRFLVTSLDLPANSEVVIASAEQPCIGLVLKLDVSILAELIAKVGLPPARDRMQGKGAGIGSMTEPLETAVGRLLALLDEPEAIPVLAPLVLREIHYRLLHSDQSARLRQITAVDGQGYRIAKAIDWLKLNFSTPLRIDELAARVQMSAPTFHHHFRQLTAMSPLQYQKWLRLNEARRLMLNERLDVSRAAFAVGYESPSQFSREYGRLFGAAPRHDIALLRGQVPETMPSGEAAQAY
ncbi:AraC family transcriptional regulator [Pseudomonas vanderleydeniana]|uniref:AraC family transcriptional regulator n=1 Tax=Pseudomonas vanderleydeniana TaxID=2745495 RepID=A0A9E6PHF0_9PSED|nr:AraC family transcriptional regulator [Pseudomonas vanderleydeniana]QXI26538.1 AraC family transcriptional regulator [Pseudomonas vanderleydeniana]